jgi:hypothetical protein
MPKKTNTMQSGGYQIGRLMDQSGGMVDSVVYPTLLNDNEAASLKNISLDEKGTVKTCKGRTERFASAFDASNACNGITAFYPDTATSRLVFGAGAKLYKDTPHLTRRWDVEADWLLWSGLGIDKTGGTMKIGTAATATTHTSKADWDAQTLSNVETASSAGDVKLAKEGTDFSETDTLTADFNGTHSNTQATGDSVKLSGSDYGSDQCSGGTALENGHYDVYSASRLFDNDSGATQWISNESGAGVNGVSYFGYDFGAGVTKQIRRVVLYGNGGGDPAWTVTSVKIQYSDNGSLWSDAATSAVVTGYNTIIISDSGTHRYWRVLANSATGGNRWAVYECEMMEGNYASSGTYTHGEQDISGAAVANAATITFNKTTPANTALTFDYRVYSSGAWGAWQTDVASGVTIIAKGTSLTGYKVQWRANLSTTNTIVTPELNDVTVAVTSGYKTSGTITSIALENLTLGGAVFTFSKTTPAGTTVTVEYAESDDNVTYGAYAAVTSGTEYGSKQWVKYRVTLSTTDVAATPTFSEISIAPKPYALSPSVDISAATATGSGQIAYVATFNGTSSAAIKTRTSANGTTWGAWTAIDGSGNIGSAHNNYIQVMLDLSGDNSTNNPTFDNLVLSYDGTAAATELATGFTAGSQFYFATLLAKLAIVNKLDAPKLWDGTNAVAAMGGSPPHGQYVAAHKNFLFMAHTTANPSRLHFSEVINLESWPALNFIDISPNDGDWITGLLPFDDYLIITKQRSVWVLVGTGTSDFEVKRIHSGIGCVAPRSLVRMGDLFGFASTEGFYLSDITKPVLITERLKDTWDGLNKRRLSQIAAEFYDHKLRIDAPNGNSMVNNIRIIYDSIRKCLYLEEFDDHASCYAKYTEAGQEILLYGHSTEGQVSQADDGTSDAGAAIDFEWKTKHFNFGSSATEKKVRNTYIAAVPAASDVTLSVYFIVDNVEVGTPISVTVSGSANEDVKTYKLKPRDVGIRKVRTLGYRIVQSTTNGGVKIHELLQEYLTKKIKAS